MASQSAMATNGKVVSAEQLDFEQKMFSHPDYQFQLVAPNNFGNDITLASNRVPVTFNIPDDVFNWDPTELMFEVQIPAAGAGQFTWYALQALKEISRIEFFAQNTQVIVDIDNFQNYIDLILKKESALEDFLSYDNLIGVSRNNCLANMVPALRNGNFTDANLANQPAYASSVNYTEPAYYKVTPTNTPLVYQVQFPMGLIKNTAFAINKDMYYGGITYLRLTFGPITKVCYISDSNANPSAGTKATFPLATSKVTKLQLMLAVEKNQSIVANIKNDVMTKGISYVIPFVLAFKTPNRTAKQTVIIPLDAGSGMTLMKVIHAVYNNTEDVDLAYDHANTDVNSKVMSYYTQLRSSRIQELNLDCTVTGPYFDYMQHKNQLKGSVLTNMDVYKYNWFHCDDFTNVGNEYLFENGSSMIAGIPLGDISTTWSFIGTITRASDFQHHTYCIVSRLLKVKGGKVEVSA